MTPTHPYTPPPDNTHIFTIRGNLDVYVQDFVSFLFFLFIANGTVDGECYEFKREEELYFTFRIVDICIFSVHKIIYFKYISTYFFTDV